MATASPAQRFWRAATTAFLKRQLHHQRMRVAGLRALRGVSTGRDDRLELDFDDASDALVRAAPWLATYAPGARARWPRAGTLPAAPPLSVVMLIVGSRGDVQPFVPVGVRLAERHRVRIATHAEFRPLVERAGLEFYPLAGDPHELMEYMVKTGGRIIPTRLDQIVEDVPRKRQVVAEILESTWRACTEPDPEHPAAAPFVADWIIANPPSYGHFHCAEALHAPLHMVFTMPWTPTSAFPHPFTRLPPGGHNPVRNWFSYGVVDMLMWTGVADLINEFRERTLGLPPIELNEGGPSFLNDNEVPFTNLFPDTLVPRPADWGRHVDLASFIFSDAGATYQPPRELLDFLAAGERPIYVGFGSCVVEDPAAVTRVVFEALEKVGARAIVSRGWGQLGDAPPPAGVHVIGDCPHDWLFARCRAVCHHGGAGTTAAGLGAGLPTVVVPFFGDQFFWGEVIGNAGAGPSPVPIDTLTTERLAEAFAACADPDMRRRAQLLGARIRRKDGVELAVRSLYRHLPVTTMQCVRDPEHRATVFCEPCRMRLCASCHAAEHAGHRSHPYRYVEWGARKPYRVARVLKDLVVDAATALRAGLEEITPLAAPRRGGVVLGDVEGAEGDDGGPVRASRGR